MRLTLRQAAERLGTTRQNLYKMAKRRGMLKRVDNPYVRGGFHFVLSLRDIEKMEKGKK